MKFDIQAGISYQPAIHDPRLETYSHEEIAEEGDPALEVSWDGKCRRNWGGKWLFNII